MKRLASDRVSVVVVDDSAVARSAIEDAVRQAGDFDLVASVESGDEALAVVPRVDPDLILLDIRMAGLDGHETCRLLRAGGSQSRIVLVSALDPVELPVGIESCGANAILHKGEASPRRLSAVWRQLQADDALLRPDEVAVADSG
jgi:DNA-binding NarL/FixJ family response regulator